MKNLLACLALGVAIGSVYYNSLAGGFVFDDYLIVVSNPILPKVAARPWLAIFPGVLGYRPFRTLSYVLDYWIGGKNPWIFHLTNLLYHWVTACLVFFTALRLTRTLGRGISRSEPATTPGWCWQAALGAALLWALHPIQTDAVAYISGRRDILSTLFFLAGFLLFLKLRMDGDAMGAGRRVLLIVAAFFAYLLGMASKEMAVTLPLVLFCYDLVRARQNHEERSERRFWAVLLERMSYVLRTYRALYLPLFLGAAAFVWYAVVEVRPSRGWGWYGGSIVNNFLTVARIWVYYLWLLVYPKTLVADYTGLFSISQSILEWRALAALGLLCSGAVVVGLALRRNQFLAFAGLWFAVTLLPVSHLVPHHELMAEHYLYLPSIGFCLMVGYVLARVSKWLSGREWRHAAVVGQGVGYGALLCVLVLYGERTATRNADWRDELSFYSRLVEDNPHSARARLGLGSIYDRSGMPRMAITHYHVGLKLSPSDPRLYINVGTSYQRLGMLKEAERAYTTALQIVPDDMRIHSNLGFLYTELRQYDKARAALERAEQLSRGRDPAVYANLSRLYEETGELTQAVQAYQKAVALASTNEIFAMQLKRLEKKLQESTAQGSTTQGSTTRGKETVR
jgi:Flp pilus assembly protein TadD